MKIRPLSAIDFYKADHRSQYPAGTEEVYSNFTPRSNRLAKVYDDGNGGAKGKIVNFGLQYFCKQFLINAWNDNFFNVPLETVVDEYKQRMDTSLGEDAIDVTHIRDLHKLGYLPIVIKALPEGARVPIGVPVFTIRNTLSKFYWLTNYLESVMSAEIWKPITTATTAFEYKRLLVDYATITGSPIDGVQFQSHDFSFRGMSGMSDSAICGAGHLTSFFGTDSVLSIDLHEDYYNADATKELIGCSVPATEHSVMCMGEQASEINTFRRLINDIYPNGIVSIVSDTWDFWKVMTEYAKELKSDILARDGKTVFRPDSGNPIDIICGDPKAKIGTPEYKGAVRCLIEVFGSTTNDAGYEVMNEKVGLIYGDSITLERAEAILERLKNMGLASCNIVFGVGSFTYQYVTRDTHGFAVKATSGVVNGVRRDIFKNPKTDNGTKKSAKGLLRVEMEHGEYVLYDQQSEDNETRGELDTVFVDGQLVKETSLSEIRTILDFELNSGV